ncbi:MULTISPECIES: hypothetical protein [unclassified Paenibacillus]|uniref:Transposase n=1 Tax=Paenibacillus provencensis TaxID=441151 RepID=A0ABW3Q0M1_9BACL|nr:MULTISPECIES: hypothetical protein [unclassified Paenibacillus]MCM3130211.1 hypothetical protein [Paenibacillus sp. MER 78]SDX71757.1 hypothetical protein SAMN05518848_112102 [Paenibacillus sp. PDC88]SFS88917.1 hypothetical protein SAMN04488601_10698 [Paenibacillus sp. 453mf]
MKVSFIIESSNRIQNGPAHEFYRGKGSRWITAVIDYLKECKFPKEHIYFLSFYNQRIIGFDEVVEDYPLNPAPKRTEQKAFSNKIYQFISEKYAEAEIDLHVSKSISAHLVPMLEASGRKYTLFAEGVQLGMKPNFYKDLILQERAMRKMKELQNERNKMIAVPQNFTPHEAEQLIEQYGHLGKQFGIDQLFSEIKKLLKTYRQQSRQSLWTSNEFYDSIPANEVERLQSFFGQIHSISDLIGRGHTLEEIKQRHGRLVAKFTNCLIKQQVLRNTENRISEVLLRVQIVLLKG